MRTAAWEGMQTPPKRKTQRPEGLCYNIATGSNAGFSIRAAAIIGVNEPKTTFFGECSCSNSLSCEFEHMFSVRIAAFHMLSHMGKRLGKQLLIFDGTS